MKGKWYVVRVPHPGSPAFANFLFIDDAGKWNWTIWRGKPLLGGEEIYRDTLEEIVHVAAQARGREDSGELVVMDEAKIGILFIPD